MQEIPVPSPPPSSPPASPVTGAVWPWRQPAVADAGEGSDEDAARRTAAVRSAIALVIAVALAFWKPWLAVVVVSVSLITLALALASPLGAYAKLERGLERFAYGVGMTVTWILMPLLYYLLFLPTGLLLRSAGKLRLTRGPEADLPTYWVEPHRRRQAGDGDPETADRWQGHGLDHYRRQF